MVRRHAKSTVIPIIDPRTMLNSLIHGSSSVHAGYSRDRIVTSIVPNAKDLVQGNVRSAGASGLITKYANTCEYAQPLGTLSAMNYYFAAMARSRLSFQCDGQFSSESRSCMLVGRQAEFVECQTNCTTQDLSAASRYVGRFSRRLPGC
jgi:hypothetical protein